jgi:hypothetical protein
MSAVTRFFFRSPYAPEPTTWAVIEWWETRRLPYNLAVGTAGLVTLATLMVAQLLHGGSHILPPWQPIVVYGVAANFCYSLGAMADLYILKRWGARYAPVGATIFRYGFVFSLGLTLLPIPIGIVSIVLGLLKFM